MKTLREREFLRWAGQAGLFLDQRYPQSAVLSFRPDPELDRFWDVPAAPERRPYFIASLLDLMGDWQSCKGMDTRGFPLPDTVPDATFKEPPWMKGL